VAGVLGFVFKYVTDVTIPGLGVVVLALAIAGINGGCSPSMTKRSGRRACTGDPHGDHRCVDDLSVRPRAGDRLGASVPKRISLKQLRNRTLSTDVIELVGGRGRVSVEVTGEVNDMEDTRRCRPRRAGRSSMATGRSRLTSRSRSSKSGSRSGYRPNSIWPT